MPTILVFGATVLDQSRPSRDLSGASVISRLVMYNQAMSIVTKTGDKGETGLFDGRRIPKTDPKLEAIGDLDELAAGLGLINRLEIQKVQDELFILGALVANPGKEGGMSESLKRIEREIDAIEPTLPKLQNFILPGGHADAARLHLARAVCRRAERHLCAIKDISKDAAPYLNRLSDYLFILARKINFENHVEEKIWKA